MVGAATLFWLAVPQLAVDDVTTTLPYYFLSDPVSTSQPLLHFFAIAHSLTSEKISRSASDLVLTNH